MTKSTFYFPYIGGKNKEFDLIAHFIKFAGIDKIVEPFAGSGAFSFNCFWSGFNGDFYLNDNDPFLIAFLKDVQKNGSKHYIDWTNRIIGKELTKERHDAVIERHKTRPTLETFFYYNKIYAFHKGLFPNRVGRRRRPFADDIFTEIDAFFRSKHVHYSNLDYSAIFNKFKEDKRALLFLDPPYFESFNNKYYAYQNGDTPDDVRMYRDIAEFIKTCKCKVVMVVNAHEYLKELFKGYIKHTYRKRYEIPTRKKDGKVSQNKATHILVSNF